MSVIKINNLRIEIKDKVLLDNINFEINNGKTFAIIGESGSGKTLLSKLLIGKKIKNSKLSGEITYCKKNLLEITEKEWIQHRGKDIAYLAQNPMAYFNPMSKIEEFAKEVFKSHMKITDTMCLEMLIDALTEFNLQSPENIIDKYPFQLSGGMLQRIMFAIILKLDPKVLIVDEPTSALDSQNTQNIIDILLKFKMKGKTLVIITHDYKLLKALADDIVILKSGKMLEYGNLDKIMTNSDEEYTKELLMPRIYSRKDYY